MYKYFKEIYKKFTQDCMRLLLQFTPRFFLNILGQKWFKEVLIYGVIGVINTIIGVGLCLLLTFLGCMPEIANTIGNIVGMLNSYILNRKFTFQSSNSHKQDFLRFVVAIGVAYSINICVLVIAYRILHYNVYLCQILAAIAYTMSSFSIIKLWVFKK
ncbi:GtrA family protein [Helicobacter aurati]|uniref:GtrA family protein n=1 Tax=Helicobacter aurati TaxID=137778 RepID=A0A3D8J2P8_9HELI|nr:GtrA family protein [Helicobacter aurati]RDU71041.1 GtrA family protein [Helicobacter aurati]